ncbi:glutathione S-transferase N-terminal domain-containing protein [Pyruvatibacter sp.]|uniref:glutathione S-transferase family protein n=1 Tax=Pyruvatibacter sp. TaxID=1981328 RepID=UPI0032ED8EA9
MKIYDYGIAPNPRRVRIFLHEKGIDVPFQTLDILKHEGHTPEFLAKNPLGGIPVLELDDGTCISESVAICRYFEALHPDPPLFGATPTEIAQVDMWLRRIEIYLMSQVGLVWLHGHKATAHLLEQKPDVAEFGRARTHHFYSILNTALEGKTFLACDRYTAVESVALATLDFAVSMVGVPYKDDHINLKSWHEMMSARDSAGA